MPEEHPQRPTVVLPVDSAEALPTAAALLRAGKLVAFPTETVYGLGANALDAQAVASIFRAKGRPNHNPVILHIAGQEQLFSVVAVWPPLAQELASRFWPGPLTLVLTKNERVPANVTGGGPTVAVRWPSHPVAQELIRLSGVPVAAPSANRSSELSPTRAEHVVRSLAGRIDLVLDGGPTTAGIESTVLSLAHDRPTLLRPGPITVAELEEVCGIIQHVGDLPANAPLPAPGLLARHYAPRTPVELCNSAEDVRNRWREMQQRGHRVGVLAISPMAEAFVLPADPVAYATQLYDRLHQLDAGAYEHLLIELPPDTPAWLAVRDRLKRAGTPA